MSRKALSGWGNSSFDLDGQASKLMAKESHTRSISIDLILTIHQGYSTLPSFAGKQFGAVRKELNIRKGNDFMLSSIYSSNSIL
jgi:hypothetical protein